MRSGRRAVFSQPPKKSRPVTTLERDELYPAFRDRVSAYVESRVHIPQDAEDLVSSVFLKVYAALDAYDPGRAALSTWIYRITHNAVCDYYRARARRGETVPLEDCPWLDASMEEVSDDDELLEALGLAMEALSQRERDVIILRFYKGWPPAKVAEAMGLSYENAKYIQHTALKKLRRVIGAL